MGLLDALRRRASRRSPSPPQAGQPFSFQVLSTQQASTMAYNYPYIASNDPPPLYTPSASSTRKPIQTPSQSLPEDDPYAFLSTFDTVFLIDDSSSMLGTRWSTASSAIAAIAPICTSHDLDGIDIHFLNAPSHPSHHNVTSAAAVAEIFHSVRPYGGTPTGQALDRLLRDYIKRYERSLRRSRSTSPRSSNRPGSPQGQTVKPLNIIVITDGVPTDDVESPLLSAARKLDKLDAPAWQVGVQFFQVGEDEGAAEVLRQLDDGLGELAGPGEKVRDMVDTVAWQGARGQGQLTAEGILKVVLGAVNRRLDRRSVGVHV